MNEAAETIGAALDLKKSDRVGILAPRPAPVEFKTKEAVSFVAYSFSSEGTLIRTSSVEKVKRRIAYLVYNNLLEAPKSGILVPSRFQPPVVRDYVALI